MRTHVLRQYFHPISRQALVTVQVQWLPIGLPEPTRSECLGRQSQQFWSNHQAAISSLFRCNCFLLVNPQPMREGYSRRKEKAILLGIFLYCTKRKLKWGPFIYIYNVHGLFPDSLKHSYTRTFSIVKGICSIPILKKNYLICLKCVPQTLRTWKYV